jgi:predicted RNA-binding Zn-ribbon protein involved in translation (DUF1610 family)
MPQCFLGLPLRATYIRRKLKAEIFAPTWLVCHILLLFQSYTHSSIKKWPHCGKHIVFDDQKSRKTSTHTLCWQCELIERQWALGSESDQKLWSGLWKWREMLLHAIQFSSMFVSINYFTDTPIHELVRNDIKMNSVQAWRMCSTVWLTRLQGQKGVEGTTWCLLLAFLNIIIEAKRWRCEELW